MVGNCYQAVECDVRNVESLTGTSTRGEVWKEGSIWGGDYPSWVMEKERREDEEEEKNYY